MENKVSDFEEYLHLLQEGLRLNLHLSTCICSELREALYDKYRELLSKGYSPDAARKLTLSHFEDPKKLARAFHYVHKEDSDLNKAVRFIHDKKAMFLVALIAVLVMVYTA